ncbi:uncharacterized protein KY384_007741 [Bacidia gigantensis]|uniref:uncharacterized protein n=1 Tax=Bacidia gigantensis TaxID=2732470 RepID=UPI001D04766A|nr:uncharacterized protein KY384_007741 [Bacidia gigantensis]KAG8527588.1 hypothetical protein KY384_007741 [Bacidia gigantensis]
MTTPNHLPADAIQRVLFVHSKVHVYNIPPLTSNKGYLAASWTENNNARQIFTARVRILETAIPPSATNPHAPETISVDVLLEDPNTGDLFAGAPYADKLVVEAAVDSSRFFAVRVVGDGGRKAVLGLGFEERSEAIDFGICLQECRKTLGYEGAPQVGSKARKTQDSESAKKDWSLKEGETIKIDIGNRAKPNDGQVDSLRGSSAKEEEKALFSIKPPPSTSNKGIPALAPPQEAQEGLSRKRRSRGPAAVGVKELGFDDDFGEFQ